MSQVGARIRAVRESRGLTLVYVADLLHISESTMSRYETGERKIVADLLAPLGEVMRVDPCEFLRPQAAQSVPASNTPLDLDAERLYRRWRRADDADREEAERYLEYLEWRRNQ